MREHDPSSVTNFSADPSHTLPEPSEAEVASTIGVLEQTIRREEASQGELPSPIKDAKTNQQPKKPGALFLLVGVILPCITFGVELTTRMSATDFIDPLPTPLHVLLVAFVPFGNLLLWLAPRREWHHLRQPLGFINGVVLGIAIFYSLIYLPMLPIGVMALIFFGIGLLPLTPPLALIATMTGRRHLRNLGPPPVTGANKTAHLWKGLLVGLGIFILAEVPGTLTHIGLNMAASEQVETSNRGVRFLRRWGSRDRLLDACYARRMTGGNLVGMLVSLGDPVSVFEARKIYYRVTGEAFVDDGRQVARRGWFDFDFDPDRSRRNEVGALAQGLSLAGSRMDQSVDGNAAVAYTEWTLNFKNTAERQQEARAQIALPPGALVSRLTLWVNGEEREAAFAGKAKVREAYEQVVNMQRDPVLVTTNGPDRVLMRCFPVPPNGGEMKVRLGITVPLQIASRDKATLRLPFFAERNFITVGGEMKHSLWIESKQPLKAESAALQSALKGEAAAQGGFALRGIVTEPMLTVSPAVISVARSADITASWSPDPLNKDGDVIVQTIEEKAVTPLSRVVVVIDGSQHLRAHLPQLSETLKRLPDGMEAQVLFVADDVLDLSNGVQRLDAAKVQRLAAQLQEVEFVGGQDNVPALERAWDVAAEKPNSAVVWLHAPQPVLLVSVESLVQRWERRPGNPLLYSLVIGQGNDQVTQQLDDIAELKAVPRSHDLAQDVAGLFAGWNNVTTRLVVSRAKISRSALHLNNTVSQGSTHLARLWAGDQVARMLASTQGNKTEEAQKFAASYQLVTSVTGAVVLETQQQYDQAGLKPVNPNTVPTIPEPETWALIAVVGAVFLWLLFRRKRRCEFV